MEEPTQELAKRSRRENQAMDALYYPRIEVSDSSWLLSGALLWERLRTITPDIPRPYTRRASLELMDEGILVPERVSPQSPPALAIAERIEDLLTSPHVGLVVGNDSWLVRQSHIHRSKIESNLQHAIDSLFGRSEADPDFCTLPTDIGAAYMLTLATAVAEEHGYRIVTDEPQAFRAAEAVLWPEGRQPAGDDLWPVPTRRIADVAEHVVDVALTHIAHHWLRVSPDTPTKRIIAFRRRRHDELVQLHEALHVRATQLVGLHGLAFGRDEARELARRLLEDDVQPALAAVKECLRESKIDFALDTVEAAIASELPGGLAAMLTTPWALVAAPVLTIVTRSTRFFLRRHRAVADSPYSYLVRAQSALTE